MELMVDDRRLAALQFIEQQSASSLTPVTIANIVHWLTEPACAEFWPALVGLIEKRNFTELTRLFWERIPFGTGGRRGPMAALGSATINRRTIAESAWALATYVLQQRDPSLTSSPQVAIACDSRLRSLEFSQVTASVFSAAGFQVWVYAQPRATPQLSFTVRHFQCDCGVVISASHNPPADNGFKAYWSNGGQVLPPHDQGIIALVDRATSIPQDDFDAAVAEGKIRWIPPDVDAAYVLAVVSLSRSAARDVSVLYTPLHGVGESSVGAVLKQSGFHAIELFEPQRPLDGAFPNVPDHLPNPERAAVFGPANHYAETHGHDIVLATDPDADRVAVAVRTAPDSYVCLNGNQLGALLADYAMRHRTEAAGYVLQTLVTTPLIATIARAHHVPVVTDLPVGFKYIGGEMDQQPGHLIFAAEESLGYLSGDYARDKDAAVAALWCCELAAEQKALGKTLVDHLRDLYQQYGWHRESQVSHTCPGPTGAAQIAELVRQFRTHPPAQLGSIPVQRIRDYGRQEVRSMPAHSLSGSLPIAAGDLLFADVSVQGLTGQVALRPSGTEPKIKCYYFVQAPASMPARVAEERTQNLLKDLQFGLAEWIETVVRR